MTNTFERYPYCITHEKEEKIYLAPLPPPKKTWNWSALRRDTDFLIVYPRDEMGDACIAAPGPVWTRQTKVITKGTCGAASVGYKPHTLVLTVCISAGGTLHLMLYPLCCSIISFVMLSWSCFLLRATCDVLVSMFTSLCFFYRVYPAES